jgi:hypothetical protein
MKPFSTHIADITDLIDHQQDLWPWLGQTFHTHRKAWEYVYVHEQFKYWAKGKKDIKVLGFGCGLDRIPAALSTYENVSLCMVTDGPPDPSWSGTNQHIASREQYVQSLGQSPYKAEKIRYQYLDMNNLQKDRALGYDFMYSLSSLEHLGSMKSSIRFIIESSRQLNPGGMAAHCTEYNLGSKEDTYLTGPSVFFRDQDLETVRKKAGALGLEMSPLHLKVEPHPFNSYIDSPPYLGSPSHLKLHFDRFIVTSFGFCIRKPL